MKIGFTTTSLRQIKSLEKIVKIAVDSGVDIIEWGGDIHIKDIKTAEYAKKLCDENGIKISSYGSYYRVGSCDNEKWERICKIASALGAESVRVWLGKRDSEKTDEKTYKILIEDTKIICKTAMEYGLFVCPECHDNTYNNNTEAFLKILEDTNTKNLGTYFQSRYKRLSYDLDRIKKTLPFIKSVHISFSEQRREQFPKYAPSYIDTLLDELIKEGFDGNLLLEYTYPCQKAGSPKSLHRDILKLKEKVGIK